MPEYCKDCGCKIYGGHCVNCHEETFIYEQYRELNMPNPSEEFMDKVIEQSYNLQIPPQTNNNGQ